jgi:long-chain acyl-CoA synthetase
VAPAPIENKLKEDFLVEQVMVVGEQRKFVSAIILPAEDALKDWCENHGVEWKGLQDAVQQPKVIAKYQAIIDQYNPGFSKIEQIKKFCLIAASWEPSRTDGTAAELTPTMKLKRRVIRDKYQQDIEAIYS